MVSDMCKSIIAHKVVGGGKDENLLSQPGETGQSPKEMTLDCILKDGQEFTVLKAAEVGILCQRNINV